MTLLTRTGLFTLVVIILAFVATPNTKADPLFFSNVTALQNSGSTSVDLFSHPGTTLLGPQVSFLVDITGTLPPGVTNTLMITYTEAGSAPITQIFQIPLFGNVPPPFTLLFTVNSPGATSQGVLATLTVDILGSSPDFIIPGGPNAGQRVDSYTYSFIVARPVPEPATVLIFAAGLLGVATRLRKKRLITYNNSR
jgi:hypothetical protein